MGQSSEQIDIEVLATLIRDRRHDREPDFLPEDRLSRDELLAELVLVLDDLRTRTGELEAWLDRLEKRLDVLEERSGQEYVRTDCRGGALPSSER